RAGAPGPNKSDPELRKIDVRPGTRTLRPDQTQQLRVVGEYSDGAKRDVTWLCRFDSNDAGVAEVDARGKVTVRRHGETSIRVSFMTQVAVVVVSSPYDQKVDPARLAVRHNFIDEHV